MKMNREELINTLKDMVRASVMENDLEMEPDDHLKDDIGLDSMGIVELAVSIESHFEIKITEDELGRAVYFKDVIEIIEEKTTAGA